MAASTTSHRPIKGILKNKSSAASPVVASAEQDPPERRRGAEKYRYQDEDVPPQEHISPQITSEVIGPELVHVSERNLSEIENVHGFVSHSHISSVKQDS